MNISEKSQILPRDTGENGAKNMKNSEKKLHRYILGREINLKTQNMVSKRTNNSKIQQKYPSMLKPSPPNAINIKKSNNTGTHKANLSHKYS